MSSNRAAIGLLALLLLITGIYSNHFQNEFHFDDSHTIVNNTYIRNIGNIPLFFKDGNTMSTLTQNQAYRPVVTTSLALDYWASDGYDVLFFHLSTFIIFLLQGVLIFFLAWKILSYATQSPALANTSALLATAWYMVHPAIAETVNYVIARSDVQSTFFVLAGFVLYANSPLCRKTGLYLLPVAIGALAKPTAVMFAPLLLLYILFFEENLSFPELFKKEGRKGLIQTIRKSAPAFVVCALLYWFIGKMTPPTWVPGGDSAFAYLITQPYVILHYFITFFVPTELSADADWQVLTGIADIRFFVGMAFILLMLGLSWYCSTRQRLRPISFGILWFFLALLPTSSFVPLGEVMNDHRMFFPFIGLAIAVVWLVVLLIDSIGIKQPTIKKAVLTLSGIVAICLLSAYAYGTHLRNEVWHTEESLWHDVTEKSPKNGRGLMNYGLVMMAKGNYREAQTYFERALQLLPNYGYLSINMGVLNEAQGNKAKADEWYAKAIQQAPGVAEPYFFYGKFLLNGANYTAAIKNLEKALQLAPSHSDVIRSLLKAYQATEDWKNMAGLSAKALQLMPGDAELLAYQQAATEQHSTLDQQATATATAPSPEKYLDMSLKYYQARRYEDCIKAANEAIRLKPDYTEAYNNICAAYNEMGKWDEAIEAGRKGLSYHPDNQLLKNNLAVAVNAKQNKK